METIWNALRKGLRFWMRLDILGSILLLIALACLVISFVGIPKELDETVDAWAYTQSGERLPCRIRMTGEITRYPFRNFEEHQLLAYRENNLISEMTYNTSRQQYGYCQNYRFTGIKDLEKNVLVAELDLNTLFPERESQRCVVVAPAGSLEAASAIVQQSGVPEEGKDAFSWLWKEKEE